MPQNSLSPNDSRVRKYGDFACNRTTRIMALVAIVLLVLVAGLFFDTNFKANKSAETEARLTWSIPKLEHVAMRVIPASERYRLGADGWKYLLPSGGHLVHITESDGSISTHTVAMFHQLRCLEILQDAYVNEGSHRTSQLAQHCMNYLRQTMLCQMDMRTEQQGSIFTYNGFDQICYDWEPIYSEAEKNFEAFSKYSV
ncbi:hypothetical protein K435DRAFT_960112 [Dendrothele bispora CBS 962.96]|uniref:Uncharacterized protein n=1 Tax=Dendrothele bispora (strain CBS 962.96) TaxID=1314807 RepID=A0A4S8MVM1_DENBC|nr:hypothetical protein K435DRAFT_960112 [Dendrothele bispora CBS 962.96]